MKDWNPDSRALDFKLEILQTSTSVASDFLVILRIANKTDKSFQLEEVDLKIPESIAGIRDYSSTFECNINRIEYHGVAQCLKKVDPVTPSEDFGSIESLFFVPDEYTLVASIKYREAIEDKPFVFDHVRSQIYLRPSLSAILRGGIIGVFLLSIFRAAYRLRTVNLSRKMKHSSNLLVMAAAEGLALVFFGSVVSVVVIVLSQRMSDLSLPISIKVEDALGGMVVGLFSAKLGDWLYEKLFFLDEEENDKDAKPNGV